MAMDSAEKADLYSETVDGKPVMVEVKCLSDWRSRLNA